MHGFCDSCEESSDHLVDLTRLPQFRDVVRRLNYRNVCQICYDDLYDEVKNQPDADDRRQETRYPLKLRVNIEGTDREGHKFSQQTFTEDVSTNGMRVIMAQNLESGTVLNLTVPDLNFEAAVIIEVVWQNGKDQSFGLKLTEANDSWASVITKQALALGL